MDQNEMRVSPGNSRSGASKTAHAISRKVRALAAVSLVGVSAWAHAIPVTYNFGGTVTSSFLPSQFAVGSGFAGSFTFDNAAADSDVNAASGFYSSGFAISATIGGITYSNQAGAGAIKVWNNLIGRDRFDAQVQGTLGNGLVDESTVLAGFDPFVLRAVFDDTTQALFNSDALPGAINLGSFNSNALQLSFYQGVNQVNVLGDITSLQLAANESPNSVPEPATGALMLFGLGALALWSRRRKT